MGLQVSNGGVGGTPYFAATFDGTSKLTIFNGRLGRLRAMRVRTYLNTFTLTAIPVPAAVWLFGSALGLLGISPAVAVRLRPAKQ